MAIHTMVSLRSAYPDAGRKTVHIDIPRVRNSPDEQETTTPQVVKLVGNETTVRKGRQAP